jgi:hypothetical protein
VTPAPPVVTTPLDVDVHAVDARVFARDGYVFGVLVRDATPAATAWSWRSRSSRASLGRSPDPWLRWTSAGRAR